MLFKPPHILVAEDSSTNQILISTLLNTFGLTYKLVANGELALQAILQTKFDLILMDTQMPEMDGFEATRKLRKAELASYPRMPIIAMIANDSKEEQQACLASGMDLFIAKPIKRDTLIEALKRFLKIN